jgi:hypothetical protein
MPSRLATENLATLTPSGRADFSGACSYAWGWQDRGNSDTGEGIDSSVSFRFGECWAAYRAAYGIEAITHMTTMRAAWEHFMLTGEIVADAPRGGRWVIRMDNVGEVKPRVLPVPNTREY